MSLNNKKLLSKSILNQQGITLMETVFALAILVIGILAVLTMTTSSVVLSQASEQNIVVVNLAREGLELVRGIRDFARYNTTQAIEQTILPEGVTGFFEVPNGCYKIGVIGGQFALTKIGISNSCDSVIGCNECKLYRDPQLGLYTYDDTNAIPTPFRRAVQLIKGDSNMRVLSKVAWTERGRNHEFMLEDYLTEWQ